ncbi:MAG: ribonuclease HIII [Aquificae bacterium]|nr:ribonuclease HIII [Aquificota bacterium]
MPFFRLSPEEGERLKEHFRKKGLKEVEHQHALWAFDDEGTRVFFYATGTLGITGKKERALAKEVTRLLKGRRVAGCDEAGKGDLFGPLVVCCACITEEAYARAAALNPRDTKRLSDARVFRLYEALKPLVKVFCKVVSPEEYNRRVKTLSVNKLLDEVYRELVERVLNECRPEELVVDAYARKSPFNDERVRFEPKAERHLAVSVASVFARALFLKELEKLSKELGIKLPKGASEEAQRLARTIKEKERYVKTNFSLKAFPD